MKRRREEGVECFSVNTFYSLGVFGDSGQCWCQMRSDQALNKSLMNLSNDLQLKSGHMTGPGKNVGPLFEWLSLKVREKSKRIQKIPHTGDKASLDRC